MMDNFKDYFIPLRVRQAKCMILQSSLYKKFNFKPNSYHKKQDHRHLRTKISK